MSRALFSAGAVSGSSTPEKWVSTLAIVTLHALENRFGIVLIGQRSSQPTIKDTGIPPPGENDPCLCLYLKK